MSTRVRGADPSDYYDKFSQHYDARRHEGYHALIDDLEASFVAAEVGGWCLEAGCGTGLILSRLAGSYQRVVGVDLSAGMLAHAGRRGHRVAQGSVNAIPFASASFDTVCSFKVLAHVADIRGAVEELARVVRPGGRLVLEFYNRRSLRGLRWRVKMLVGGERTGAGTAETDLFTRYDDLASIARYLPDGVSIEAVRGCIVFAPAALCFRVPLVGQILTRLERMASASFLARYAGFVTVVLRKA